MKVRITVDADELTRFVVAKYFAPVSTGTDQTRTRATRVQVRRFIVAALQQSVREHASVLRGKARATAKRLAAGQPERETLREPDEKQQSLVW